MDTLAREPEEEPAGGGGGGEGEGRGDGGRRRGAHSGCNIQAAT